MNKIVVVADEAIWGIDTINDPRLEIRRFPGSKIASEHLRDADALFTRSVTKVDRNLLQKSSVKFVGSATIGTDHLDLSELERRNIRWVNAPGCNAQAVTQWVLAAFYRLRATQFEWSEIKPRVGIIGCGQVGSRVAERLSLLGYEVFVNDPPLERINVDREAGHLTRTQLPEGRFEVQFRSLSVLLKSCDIISIHTPLTRDGPDATFHLLNASSLHDYLRRGGQLINTARGGVIDENGIPEGPSISGALVLDVWENEPNLRWELLKEGSPVILASPHVAGYSVQGKSSATKLVLRDFEHFFDLGARGTLKFGSAEGVEQSLKIDVTGLVDSSTMIPEEIVVHCVAACTSAATQIDREDSNLRAVVKHAMSERGLRFEQLRRGYPFRQEFENFEVEFLGMGRVSSGILESIACALMSVGFREPTFQS